MSRLAVLEIHHSRPIAPTRRVALGTTHLPVDPAPGPGGVLLAGVVAAQIPALDPDLIPDVVRLTHDLEDGRRIPQPRLRYRFQTDRVGLRRSRATLSGTPERVRFDLAELHGTAEQHLLGACYAMGRLAPAARTVVAAGIRRAIGWIGPLDHQFVRAISGSRAGAGIGPALGDDPGTWALGVLGLDVAATEPATEEEVRARYRVLLREAHPDHGGAVEQAAARIAELAEARRILAGS